MGLREVKMTEEEKDAYMASRITDLADSIIMIKKYVEMFEHKPMVKADSDRCDNTIDYYRDAIMLEHHSLSKLFGDTIADRIDDEFRRVFDAGERQGAVVCARRMIASDLPRTMRDEPPCVFLSLNFKLQTNNFKQTARTGNNKDKRNGNEKTDWERRHLGGGSRGRRGHPDGCECRDNNHR